MADGRKTQRFRGHLMKYTPPPIADGQELLARIRDSLRTCTTLAIDGLKGAGHDGIHPNDALHMIISDLSHTLAVVKASKDTI